MKQDRYSVLKDMIKSKDKDSIYMAVVMSRNIEEFPNRSKVKKILDKVSLFDKIREYSDVCLELDEEELTIKDFKFLPKEQRVKALAFHQLKNIEKLFNGNWKVNLKSTRQQLWYPWFEKAGRGLVFYDSLYPSSDYFADGVAFYKDKETTDFVGKLFIDIYKKLY